MFIRFIVIMSIIGLYCSHDEAEGAQIWLAGVDPAVRQTFDTRTASDYLNLFQPNAPWEKAAHLVQVLKMSTQFLASGSDATLSRIFEDLNRRNIALGMAALMLTTSTRCGAGIEGYSSPQTMEIVASRVQRLGGHLRYVAMDEPLGFGHYSRLPNACESSLADLATDIAGKVAAIRRIFPDVQIGDTEVIGHSAPRNDVDELMEWAKAYEVAVGTPLSFVHADVVWTGPWEQQVRELAARLHAAGINFGIIYNGSSDDQTGLAWTRRAEQRFTAIEVDPAFIPDHAILQSWMQFPDRMLPETQPGTMTWLVNRYVASPTRLVLRHAGSRLLGQVINNTDQPLAGAPVTLAAELSGASGAPVLHTRSGRVPPNARSAVLALRINVECDCSGLADVGIGPVRYHDDRIGQTVERAFRPPSASAATLARFQAEPGQSITQNAPGFPITADNPFTLQVPMRTNLASAGSGYVALVFLDAQGTEVERFRLPFEPAEQPIGTVTTDAQGRFSLLPDPDTLRASVGFRAEFPGDEHHRTASATVR
jgi:hypothetical protein